MRLTACIVIFGTSVLTPALARADRQAETADDQPRLDMLGNPIERSTAPNDKDPSTPSGENPSTPSGENPSTPSGENPSAASGENPSAASDTDPSAPSDTDPSAPSDRKTTTAARAAGHHAPERHQPAGWPVPEILGQARAHEASGTAEVVTAVDDDAIPAAASEGYVVPRTVTVTYSGHMPFAPDLAPRIEMEGAPPRERQRILSLSVDPIGIIKGNYGASFARRLSDHAALRLDGQFNRGVDGIADSSSWRLGVSIPLYLNETFQGPFVEAGVAAAHRLLAIGIRQYEPYNLLALRDYTAGPEIFVGWQRLFDNGLHIAVAVGASADWTASDGHFGEVNAIYASPPLSTLAAASRTDAETYVRVGYAF